MNAIAIALSHAHCLSAAEKWASKLQLPIVPVDSQDYDALLIVTESHLELKLIGENAPGPIFVDFLKGPLAHRRCYGGGRGQMISRAVGLRNKPFLTVVDVTAGFGKDAFILATLGCDVVMLERNPIMGALLRDGLTRAQEQAWFRELKLRFIEDDAKNYLLQMQDAPDVVYLDPMFPMRTKSALVKKEMRVLRQVIGDDIDADALLALSLKIAKYRVVVKRARHAPIINGPKPDLIFSGKSCRYDVYLTVPMAAK